MESPGKSAAALNYFLQIPELNLSPLRLPFGNFSTCDRIDYGQAFIFPKEKMLGKQAETCFEYFLKHNPNYRLLSANIQIPGTGKTLGELDYIISETATSRQYHIELACKFYLWDKNLDLQLLGQWIGPNRKDRLADKIYKLETRQFPLLFTPETATALSNLSLDFNSIKQQLCLKVFLFIPKLAAASDLPEEFQHCIAGHYIHEADLHLNLDGHATYALPTKKEWLLPPASLRKWMSFDQAEEKIREQLVQQRSPLVYRQLNGKIEKFFIVWW